MSVIMLAWIAMSTIQHLKYTHNYNLQTHHYTTVQSTLQVYSSCIGLQDTGQVYRT